MEILKCFACGKKTRENDIHGEAVTGDGQKVYVGPICFLSILKSKGAGYQPPKGGPKLYLIQVA